MPSTRAGRSSMSEALKTDSVEVAARALSEGLAGALARFETDLLPALHGKWEAVKRVVAMWLVVLEESIAAQMISDPVPSKSSPIPAPSKTVTTKPDEQSMAMLRGRIVDAPGSPWVASYGKGLGTLLALVEDVRRTDPRLSPFSSVPRSGFPDLGPNADFDRYRRLVDMALRGEAPPLERVQQLFGLNMTEAAGLFGVTRQAYQQWQIRGVPETHRERLDDLLAIGELLERKLKPERVPQVAARTSESFGGLSILEMVAAGRHGEVLDELRTALDWSTTA